jgi:hypothetical protein
MDTDNNSTKSQITCQEANCNLKGYWYETLPTSERVLCFRARHHQEWHTVKLVLPNDVKELKQSLNW